MTDPHRPGDPVSPWQNTGATDPSTIGYPVSGDPAYAGQLPTYPSGYPPPNPTAPIPSSPWSTGQPPPQTPPPTPPGGSGGSGGEGPGKPPRFPTWLWLLTGAAVLLVVGLVIALAIVNGSTQRSATVTPIPPLPSASGTTTAPTRTPTTTTPAPSTGPSTTPPSTSTTSPGVPETVVYSVTGEGRALSIAYIDTGGALQTEFNVALPWTKQVTLTQPASKIASVTVVNVGAQVGCSVTVDGAQISQRTGAIFVVCTAVG
ncbi:hypothetical protein KIH27_07630 [Mycobacterium sp. M1]|uniref:Mycobacterium membrane protein n=1 Tax=Mycolicibacter acidiphilus TaxID=2835306 RepID=A0ABS5RGN7_9MYCO|nr:MmpS family transport accessory protein [Mycolicibacter acidiphilus]MBS9533460.1 hypothetical protein [Mycolicibacter acidiphilus]